MKCPEQKKKKQETKTYKTSDVRSAKRSLTTSLLSLPSSSSVVPSFALPPTPQVSAVEAGPRCWRGLRMNRMLSLVWAKWGGWWPSYWHPWRNTETNSDYLKGKNVAHKIERSLNPLDLFHVSTFNLEGDLRNFLCCSKWTNQMFYTSLSAVVCSSFNEKKCFRLELGRRDVLPF